jgi:adenylate cyclase
MSVPPDSTLANLEQIIADLRRELAQLTTERDEAYRRRDHSQAREAATAEVFEAINFSLGNPAPVFETILEKAHALCGADYGSLQLYDGEKLRALAVHNHPEALESFLREGFVPGPSHPAWRLLAGQDYIHVRDCAEVDDPMARATVEEGGIRTMLHVALRRHNKLVGKVTAGRKEVRPFADVEISLLRTFAAQAVIALDNARLLAETREALEQQSATAEVLQVINSSPGDLAPVFEAVLYRALALCGAAFGVLRIYDGELVHTAAQRGVPLSLVDFMRKPNRVAAGSASATGALLRGENYVHITDIRDSESYRAGHPFRRALADFGGARTTLWVPLRKDEAFLGAIILYRQETRPFTDRQIALLQNFAEQAVIAMENARLLGELRERTDQVAELNRGLEARVAEQVEELGRVGRLKRFLAPQLAELIVSQGAEKILESHRREIVVVFCDLRGYTAFTEAAEPEEVLDFLREYHGALGPLISRFEGTLDQFSGDGIMVYFNDPVPIPDPAERAVKMAVAMREAASTLIATLRERGRELGFGAGIAQGYATLGQIGFSERSGYTAIGTVCNVAARLCGEAKDGQILLSQRVNVALKGSVATEQVGALVLRGLTQPVGAYNVPLTASQPALRVIDGGNH